MADQNNQDIQPAVEEQQAPVEQQAPLGPSTPENQEATEDVLKAQQAEQIEKENIRKKAYSNIVSRSRQGIRAQEPSGTEILQEIRNIKAQEAQQAEIQRQLDEESQVERERLKQQRALDLKEAQELGIQLEPSDLDDEIQRDAIAAEELQRSLENQKEIENQKIAEAATPTDAEIINANQPLAAQRANEAAQELDNIERSQTQQSITDQYKKDLDELNKKTENKPELQPENFWDTKSTGQKILAAIAMFFGGYSAGMTGGRNQAMDMIQSSIDDYVEQRKLDKKLRAEEVEAEREQIYKNAMLKLNEYESKTNSELKKQQIQNMKQQMSLRANEAQMKKDALLNEQAKLKALQSGKVSDQTIGMLGPKERERAVRMPDGSYQLAMSKEAATEIRKFKNDVEPAQKAIKRVLSLSKQGSRFSLEDRARISTEMQGIVGNLRLSFLGPGAMTEQEYDRLRDTLGNPNAFFALPTVERKKLETVFGKLQGDLESRYKNAGLTAPKSKRELMIQQEVAKGRKKADVIKTIDLLIEKGKLPHEEYGL